MMKLAGLTRRLGDDAANAWHVHSLACQKRDRGENVVMLSIGEEAGETTAPVIVESAIASLKSGRHHYSEVSGPRQLRDLIAERHKAMTRQKVHADQCTVYAGAQNSLFAVAQCLLETGDEVILPEPYYTTYPGVFTCTGATAVKVSGSAENLFLSDIDAIANAITEKTRAIVITQPGNPIGSFYRSADLQKLVGICREKNIWLISDEVYSQLLSPRDRASPASFDPDCSCVVTVNSLSKSNRMTGWRLGWAVTPKALADSLAELSMVMHYGMPPFITDAAITAISEDTSTTEEIRQSMNERRAVAIEHLSKAQGVRLLDAGAGMFLVLDVSDSGLNLSLIHISEPTRPY